MAIISRLSILGCLLILGCAAERQPGDLFGPAEEGTLVIDAILLVDQSLPALYVRQTMAPNQPYTQEEAAIRDSDVVIRQGNMIYPYQEDLDFPGRYLPPPDPPPVLPNTTYHLQVNANGRQLRASTHTPPRFKIREVVLLDEKTLEVRRHLKTFADGPDLVYSAAENQITYLDGLLEARFDPIDVPAYQMGIFSLDRDSDFVIQADFLDEEDLEGFKRQRSSPPLKAVNGSKIRMPWFTIVFAGRYLIKFYALDQNWFDFIRSGPDNDNGGFGGLAGDYFERPLFNVEGGIGLFGSAAVDSLGFVILPKD